MNQLQTKALAVIVLFLVTSQPVSVFAATPAWCSANDLSEAQLDACDDPSVSQADQMVTQLYRAVLALRGISNRTGIRPAQIISDQREWVENLGQLSDAEDIREAYTNRIQALTNVLKLN